LGADLPVLLLALIVAGLLILIMRWVFTTPRTSTGRPDRGPDANLGLLAPVVSEASRNDALQAKNHLSAKGIHCSVSRRDHDHYDVLVFAPDLEVARVLLADRDPN
jgi:hypothetical protein